MKETNQISAFFFVFFFSKLCVIIIAGCEADYEKSKMGLNQYAKPLLINFVIKVAPPTP